MYLHITGEKKLKKPLFGFLNNLVLFVIFSACSSDHFSQTGSFSSFFGLARQHETKILSLFSSIKNMGLSPRREEEEKLERIKQ